MPGAALLVSRRSILVALALIFLGALAFEGWRAVRFYRDVSAGKTALLSLRGELKLDTLHNSTDEILQIKSRLDDASSRLASARSFADHDPLLFAGSLLPGLGKNARGLKDLVRAADDSATTGLQAADVLLAFNQQQDDPSKTSIQNAMAFLRSQEEPMAGIEVGLNRIRAFRARLSPGLLGPLENARTDLDDALEKLSGLVDGYNRADRLLPALLGYDGTKRYLVLPQNDTEIFPSGGLISNYGIATFDQGKLNNMDFEYFVDLFDRWQAMSGGEYVEPPAPLKNHLLRDVSWGLGEAGWYPDFPTTAKLAASFVQKGGVAPTDGTIAIDLKFVAALLDYLGPVTVPGYNVTVDAKNLSEVTLDQTRTESALPGTKSKAFLSPLSKEILTKIFNAPKDRWVGLLKVLDQMARERHFQMNFNDPQLQSLTHEYNLDGGMVDSPDDYLLLADTSVKSTKLNLILQTAMKVDVQLGADGKATTTVSYDVSNPFPDWSKGRDPSLVKALMLDGVYGSYLRLYAQPSARLRDITIDGAVVGAEQIGDEAGRKVFGRFFTVAPGETHHVVFTYATPVMLRYEDGKRVSYSVYIQKEAGTGSTPLEVSVQPPDGSRNLSATLDSEPVTAEGAIKTDLGTDRLVRVEFNLP